MKKCLLTALLTWIMIIMLLPTTSVAEESDEVDLYSPEVYDRTNAVEAPAPEPGEGTEDMPMSAEASTDSEIPMPVAEPATDETAVYAVAAPEAYPATLLLGAKEKYALNGLALSGGQPVTYASSNAKLVTVDGNGLVTAKKTGNAEIVCYLGETPLAVCAVTVAKAPKKVTLPAKSAVLGLGEWRAFGAALPAGSAGAVSYTSDNPAVLVVDEAGNIGGAAPGTAKLTATAYNGKKATCSVQVLNGPSPTWVSLSQGEAAMMAKGTLQLYAGYDAGCDAILTWTTTNKKVATVDGTGLVTAKKGGVATVTVTTHNGLTASCQVTVYTAPKKVSLNAKSLTLNVGEGAQLTAAVTANSVTEYTWSTSNAAVATVDGNGYVYATGAGKATITVTTTNGKKAKCTVKVNGPVVPSAPKKVTLNAKKATLNVGEGYQLVATLPANSISDLTWSTSNAAVAVVDANGYVTVVGPGTATITVVTVNGKKASFTVTVLDPYKPSGVSIAQGNAITLNAGESIQLVAGLIPEGAVNTLTWSSSKPKVATVDANGLVVAVGKGKTTITVQPVDYKKVKAAIMITVNSNDTTYSKDLSTCLNMNAQLVKDMYGLKQVEQMEEMFLDLGKSVTMTYSKNDMEKYTKDDIATSVIDQIMIYGKCDYTICGVCYGMSANEAKFVLQSAGWNLVRSPSYCNDVFIKDDRSISIVYENEETIDYVHIEPKSVWLS